MKEEQNEQRTMGVWNRRCQNLKCRKILISEKCFTRWRNMSSKIQKTNWKKECCLSRVKKYIKKQGNFIWIKFKVAERWYILSVFLYWENDWKFSHGCRWNFRDGFLQNTAEKTMDRACEQIEETLLKGGQKSDILVIRNRVDIFGIHRKGHWLEEF